MIYKTHNWKVFWNRFWGYSHLVIPKRNEYYIVERYNGLIWVTAISTAYTAGIDSSHWLVFIKPYLKKI